MSTSLRGIRPLNRVPEIRAMGADARRLHAAMRGDYRRFRLNRRSLWTGKGGRHRPTTAPAAMAPLRVEPGREEAESHGDQAKGPGHPAPVEKWTRLRDSIPCLRQTPLHDLGSPGRWLEPPAGRGGARQPARGRQTRLLGCARKGRDGRGPADGGHRRTWSSAPSLVAWSPNVERR